MPRHIITTERKPARGLTRKRETKRETETWREGNCGNPEQMREEKSGKGREMRGQGRIIETIYRTITMGG